MGSRLPILISLMTVAGIAAGCAGLDIKAPSDEDVYSAEDRRNADLGKVTGEGIFLFGGPDKSTASASPISVNSFLWRATLDTLSFMPLASADPFGGVIITDWFTPPESAEERFKLTVYILSRSLRSDGLKVAVFRQIRDDAGNWIDGEVTEGTARKLEDGILARARELRVAGLAE